MPVEYVVILNKCIPCKSGHKFYNPGNRECVGLVLCSCLRMRSCDVWIIQQEVGHKTGTGFNMDLQV